jgi:hypothetical protein
MGDKHRKKSFRKKTITKSNRFKYDIPQISVSHHKHPIFCFRHVHPDYNLNKCDNSEKLSLINQIDKLSSLDWQEIEYSGRHGLGTEKINVSSLKTKCPAFVTTDITHLLALRFHKKMPFLVYRDKFIAHIIFIDPKGKIYNH